jgi:hypothetical protein
MHVEVEFRSAEFAPVEVFGQLQTAKATYQAV